MKVIKIMVTGAGSGVGQGIIKALRISDLPKKIVAADINPLNAGLFRADEGLIIPRVENDGAVEKVLSIINSNNIDVIMIGSEFDLYFFSYYKEYIEKNSNACVIVSPLETVKIADDKWLTAEFLRKSNLPYAESFLPDSIEDALKIMELQEFPIIIKTRKGTSSRHVHIVNNKDELIALFNTVPNPLLQKIINLPSDNLKHEYTCSVFKASDGSILGPFTARRTLKGGSSWLVEVDEFKELHPVLIKTAELLPIMGTLNIQLMLGKQGYVPFELNARFSGTTAVRAHYGFNEPELAIRDFLMGEKLLAPNITKGIAMRYLEEVFLDGKNVAEIRMPFPKGLVNRWF